MGPNTSCDFCPNQAIANFQKVWVYYPVDKNGDYGKRQNTGSWEGHLNDNPEDEDNIHVCAIHEEVWLQGEIGAK